MSTNYFPFCVDCQSEHHIESDRMSDESRALIRVAPALAAFADAWAQLGTATCGQPEMTLEMTLGYNRDRVDVAWFKAHAGHHLVMRNEYGDNDDECGADYQCDGCKHPHRVRCRRMMKHEGSHGDARDDGRP